MVDLVKVAKTLKEKSVLLARVEAARGARSRCSEVRAPYAIARPVALHHGPRLDAPDMAPSTDYAARPVADNPAYHQRPCLDRSPGLEFYSHEVADWVEPSAVETLCPADQVLNRGRVTQVTASDAPRPSVPRAKPDALKLWRGRRLAPSMNPGRGAEVREMLVTDRPVAQSRPAFTRRHPHVYALHRSAAYVSSLHALRDAILRDVPTFTAEGTRVWGFEVLNCRRHRDDAQMSLGDLFKHHALLSGRLK